MLGDEIVTWHKSYSVNIPLIDAQHKELINLTNKLYRSCLQGRDHSKNVFMEVFRGAVDYVGYHFSTEEKVMERVGYPGYAAHKKEHADFVKAVLKTADELSRGVNPNPLGFVHYLKDWVLTHIAVSDTLLGKHLISLRQQGELQKITLRVKQVSDRFIIE
ncbi:MAG: bacteriohemerythrin [Spirochaetaceae bacterium]|jgi:hemerythrin|nr:bacteriohemerythrin [Spirochaetaceae bacterium]